MPVQHQLRGREALVLDDLDRAEALGEGDGIADQGEVEVGARAAEQEVADRAADQVDAHPGRAEGLQLRVGVP